jgi:hypothetical protein
VLPLAPKARIAFIASHFTNWLPLPEPDDLPFDGAHARIDAIAQAEHDLTKYLDRWLESPSPNAHPSLASMIVNEGYPTTKSPRSGYWAGQTKAMAAIE